FARCCAVTLATGCESPPGQNAPWVGRKTRPAADFQRGKCFRSCLLMTEIRSASRRAERFVVLAIAMHCESMGLCVFGRSLFLNDSRATRSTRDRNFAFPA